MPATTFIGDYSVANSVRIELLLKHFVERLSNHAHELVSARMF